MKFTNDTKAVDVDDRLISHGGYGYDRPCVWMLLWGPLIQRVVSQAGTKLITGNYHNHECGILVAEGGVNLDGIGELAMLATCCRLPGSSNNPEKAKISDKIASLITNIVLGWDPMQPAESMVRLAAAAIEVPEIELLKVIDKARSGGPFGGNALDAFFDRTRGSQDRDEIWTDLRPYRRYTMTYNGAMTHAEVDQLFADEDVGNDLLERMNEKAKRYGHWARFYSCKPRREPDGELVFWVNGSDSLDLKYGNYTKEQIEIWLRA